MKKFSRKEQSEFCSSNDDSFAGENIHLSLIIDDDTTVSVDMTLKENIGDVCREICSKYSLNDRLAHKLKKVIEKQLEIVFRNQEIENRMKEKNIVQRLHYQSIENNKKKKKSLEKVKKDETDNEMKKFSFTPTISQNSNRNYNKPFLHFEDKLYYDDMISKNKTQLKRIIKGVQNVVECKQYVHKPRSKGKKNGKEGINKNKENPGKVDATSENKNNNKIQEGKDTVTNNNSFTNTNPNAPSQPKDRATVTTGKAFNQQEEKEEAQKKFSFINKDQSFNNITIHKDSHAPSYLDRYRMQCQSLLNSSNNMSLAGSTNQTKQRYLKKPTLASTNQISETDEIDYLNKGKAKGSSGENNNPLNPINARVKVLLGSPIKSNNDSFIQKINEEVDTSQEEFSLHKSNNTNTPNVTSSPLKKSIGELTRNNNKNAQDKNQANNQSSKTINLKANKSSTIDKSISSQPKHIKSKSVTAISFDDYIKRPLFDRLYSSNQMKNQNREEHINVILKNTCPFQPKILEKSKTIAKTLKGRTEVFSRLCYQSKSKATKRSKVSKSSENNSHINTVASNCLKPASNRPNTSRPNSQSRTINFLSHETKTYRSSSPKFSSNDNVIINNDNVIINNDNNDNVNVNLLSSIPNSPTSEQRTRTKIKIREIKEENKLYNSIEQLNSKQDNLKKSVQKKNTENLDKFKLNNFKEIFEIIYNNCKNVKDFQNMEKFGIAKNIKEKLILPTCYIIKERNLEFNFQNFYLIANEIMNFIL